VSISVVKCGEVQRSVAKCCTLLLFVWFFYRFAYGCMFCILSFNSVSYVSLLCLCIAIVMFMYSYIYVYVFLLLCLCILIVMFMYSYCMFMYGYPD
jgi:hypothetical protein